MDSVPANTNINNNNDITGFEGWMFQPYQDIKSNLNARDSDSGSNSSWFEPLENIISSTSSSSMASPINDQLFTTTTTTSSSSNNKTLTNDLPVLIKQEQIDNVFNNYDSTDSSPNFLSSIDSILKNENNDTKINIPMTLKNKIRPTRKRLTAHQKQAHNKIEKRYRININTKIAKLQQIIPWVASEQTAFEVRDSNTKTIQKNNDNSNDITDNSNTASNQTTTTSAYKNNNNTFENSVTNATKLNKSMILEKAVDYILYLQNNERLHQMEVIRLKKELDSYKNPSK